MSAQRSGPSPAPALEPAREAPGARPMRVAVVISSLSGGGAERAASALARYWARAEREVAVITLGSGEDDAYALPAEVQREALGLLRPSRSALEGALQASRRIVALRRALERARPDVVVSFMTTTNVLALLAAARTAAPVLVCERSDPRHEPLERSWAALRRLLYPRAAAVVVQTESVAGWARAFCPRVHVIPNFVERPSRTASPGDDGGPKRLLAMGRLGPEKGFDLLVDAFGRVAAAHPDWSLTILGEGRERARLEALVASRGLQGRVTLPGRVADPGPHLAAAHAFALSSRCEGFPNALLEAMACGVPVVSFDCPSGPADIVVHGENGLLVPAGDVAGLAAALGHLMRSSAERTRMGRSARDIAVALSPERVLTRWSAALRAARGD